jgi:hypothetical protein
MDTKTEMENSVARMIVDIADDYTCSVNIQATKDREPGSTRLQYKHLLSILISVASTFAVKIEGADEVTAEEFLRNAADAIRSGAVDARRLK